VTSLDELIDALDPALAAAFAREFLRTYARAGFGRMPKREVDVLVFHLLEQATDELGQASETVAARLLGTTPSRVRGWRTDARFLYWERAQQDALVRRALFVQLANEGFALDERGMVTLELADPFVRELVVDALRRSHVLHDTSFNAALLRLDAAAFVALAQDLLAAEHLEVLAKDRRFRATAGTKALPERFGEVARAAVTAVAGEVRGEALAQVTRYVVGIAQFMVTPTAGFPRT
jgi:hypothetical protein